MRLEQLRGLCFFILCLMIAPIGYMMGLSLHPVKANPIMLGQHTAELSVKDAIMALPDIQNMTVAGQNPLQNSLMPQSPLPPLQKTLVNPLDKQSANGRIINIPENKVMGTSQTTVGGLKKIDLSHLQDTGAGDNFSSEIGIEIMGEDLGVKNPFAQKAQIEIQPQIGNNASNNNAQNPQRTKAVDLYANRRKSLLQAPVTGYTQMVKNKTLPFQPVGQKPLYQIYAHPPVIASAQSAQKASFIIAGLGMDDVSTRKAIEIMPPEVTLAFIPYSPHLQTYIDLARQYGHEVILEMPMQSEDYPRNDVGDHALLVDDTAPQLQEKLYWLLSRATGYSGIMNYLGDKFLNSEKMPLLMKEIQKRGLYFVNNNANYHKSQGIATHIKLPSYQETIIIDKQLDYGFIKQEFMNAEIKLAHKGQAMLVGYLSELTMSVMQQKFLEYESKNITLIPTSQLVRFSHE